MTSIPLTKFINFYEIHYKCMKHWWTNDNLMINQQVSMKYRKTIKLKSMFFSEIHFFKIRFIWFTKNIYIMKHSWIFGNFIWIFIQYPLLNIKLLHNFFQKWVSNYSALSSCAQSNFEGVIWIVESIINVVWFVHLAYISKWISLSIGNSPY